MENSGRLDSVDVFRGLTIAGMILVNNPGRWDAVYPPLRHAEWHGWTLTDLIFPFFLYIVGVAMAFSLARRAAAQTESRLVWQILRRALIIFALGLLIHGFPTRDATGHWHIYDLTTIRIPGVLQRIAVCFGLAALLSRKTNWRQQAYVIVGLLLFYWALLMLVPTPGFGASDLSKEGNLAAWLDRKLLAGHIYTPVYDPEGILSTLPALATTLCGLLAGQFLRSSRTADEKVAGLFVAGAAGVTLGWTWNFWFPINKALWTSSYVLFTGGLASQLLALCYWLVDVRGWRGWAFPFRVFGLNAIAVYVLSALLGRAFPLIPRPDGADGNLRGFLLEKFFASWLPPYKASFWFALAYVAFWWGWMYLLYRRKVFISV